MTTTLSIEIGAARAYATTEGSAQGDAADLAEIKVREYAGHHGTPERETTIRLATDAAEQAAESCTIRGCDRLRSGARTIEQGFNGPPRLVCAGEDTDCASATVGMGVVRWARLLTAAEVAEYDTFTARLGKAWADPGTSGRECTGDVHRERAAWVASLPCVEVST